MSHVLVLIAALFVAVLVGLAAGMCIAWRSCQDETANDETQPLDIEA
ncbi:MAG TPA: hypothetical protein VM487_20955 [Phycisphaerae bacterium]|nr:hypothetical protein [Phycisphaerae bacterium]